MLDPAMVVGSMFKGDIIVKRVFHYTVFQRLQSIFTDTEIKVATKNVPAGVKPVVWFTTNPDWEETANKDVDFGNGSTEFLNRQSMWEKGIHPIRIEVDPTKVSLRSWSNYKKNSGDSMDTIKSLEKTAKQLGSNPKQWMVSYENVPVDAIIGVSNWDGAKWQPWSKAE
jgi:hypothetical protein